jgi:hypothetical protein
VPRVPSVHQAAAERLNVCPATVYDLCTYMNLRHVRIGACRGAIRISEEALAQYLAGVMVQASKPIEPALSPGKSSRKHRRG